MNSPIVFRNHFQHAYVVRNLNKAIAAFRDQYGVAKWQIMPMQAGAPIRAIGKAYVQQVMIELIEAIPDQASVFRDYIPESESAARFHHLGYLIDSEKEYLAIIHQFEAAGIRPAFAGSFGDVLDFHYADTVHQLGHYCELVHLKSAGKNFYADVPRN